MTPFRARIREIARICAIAPVSQADIESAILRAIEELLAREPSNTMINLSYLERHKGSWQIWKAMSAQLLKECKE